MSSQQLWFWIKAFGLTPYFIKLEDWERVWLECINSASYFVLVRFEIACLLLYCARKDGGKNLQMHNRRQWSVSRWDRIKVKEKSRATAGDIRGCQSEGIFRSHGATVKCSWKWREGHWHFAKEWSNWEKNHWDTSQYTYSCKSEVSIIPTGLLSKGQNTVKHYNVTLFIQVISILCFIEDTNKTVWLDVYC